MVPDTPRPYPLQFSSLSVPFDAVEAELLTYTQNWISFCADFINKP
jgi:hypothetical protein